MNPNADSKRTDGDGRNLTTADLARTGASSGPDARTRPDGRAEDRAERRAERGDSGERVERPAREGLSEKLDALFTPDAATNFRSQWTNIQARFVDDPRQAVRDGDELVAQVMKSLAESFATERNRVETELRDGGDASTELMRVALRRYRSFFERLLAL
jgi:hypothetical protein